VIVRKRQRRLSDVDAVAISLYAKRSTTGEISAYFAEVYGASVSKGDHLAGSQARLRSPRHRPSGAGCPPCCADPPHARGSNARDDRCVQYLSRQAASIAVPPRGGTAPQPGVVGQR
jgi:hypothetical protein